MQETFQQHLQLDAQTVESLLSLDLDALLALPAVNDLLGSLDTTLLRDTLPTAGQILAQQLPPFYEWLTRELGVERVPDSPDHATKWVVGFLNNQESLTHLVELHRPVPQKALERSIPRLVSAFDGVAEANVRQEWQKAVAALCLVIVAEGYEPALAAN
ncbi:MAG: hypothetical protein ACFCU8_08445 [Thermosynechococcaceae cyanobacterium]